MNDIILDTLRLRFPGELEHSFRRDYFAKSVGQLRFGIVLGTTLYALFGLLDAWIFPEAKVQSWLIRYVIVCPLCLLTLLFTYSRHFQKYMQAAVTVTVVAGGAGIVAMMVIVRSPQNYFHFAGLLLIIMYTYTFSKLRFLYTAIASWTVVGMYEVASIWLLHSSSQAFLNDNLFYLSANLIGMFSCYHRELYMRKDFLQALTIRHLEERRRLGEKEKIFRDLHDGIGGITTNIGLLAEVAQKASDLVEIRRALATIADLSRDGMTEIRNIMHSFDSPQQS